MHGNQSSDHSIAVTRTETQKSADELVFVLQSIGIIANVRYDPMPPLGSYLLEVDRPHLVNEAQKHIKEYLHEHRLKDLTPASLPPLDSPLNYLLVFAIIALNMFMFFLLEKHGGSENHKTLLNFGAITTPLVQMGEWWRLVSAQYLHIGFQHLLANMLMLAVVSALTLRLWGIGRFFSLYLFAGTVGNIFSLLLGSAFALKAGASGAILGIMGGIAGQRLNQLHHNHSSRLKTWHVLATLLAFYGFVVGVSPRSDHIAHIAGLVFGIIYMYLIPPRYSLSKKSEKILNLSLIFITLIFLIVSAVFGLNHLHLD